MFRDLPQVIAELRDEVSGMKALLLNLQNRPTQQRENRHRPVTPETAPSIEGYTFSGWSEIPELMPDNDVEVSGTLTINSYTLTYMVDGEVYKTYSVVYGMTLTPEAEPTKSGYTFSGWSEIPVTMPAEDVVITGSFIINSYTITYVLDGEVFIIEVLEYGTEIVPPVIPGLEDYNVWEDVPETMPAGNITIYGKAKEIIDGLTPSLSNTETAIYDLQGRKRTRLQRGINIVGGKKVFVK